METGTPLQLTFDLASVAGLARVSLIERGQTMDTRELAGVSAAQDLSFWVTPEGPTWVSLVVEDVEGHLALSNPWWLTPSNH